MGKHRQGAKAELEKLPTDLTCAQAVDELARIMLAVRDDAKDEKFRLEMGIVGQTTGGKFMYVFLKIFSQNRNKMVFQSHFRRRHHRCRRDGQTTSGSRRQ
jgi:hypothetical protein